MNENISEPFFAELYSTYGFVRIRDKKSLQDAKQIIEEIEKNIFGNSDKGEKE